MSERKIKKIVTGKAATDGAGVHLVRVLGSPTVFDFDPFLMLDAFDSKNPNDYIKGFPMHPHRGIETLTYLVSGEIEHKDSLGNVGSITNGSCQYMTAGGGILHQEMPLACERMLGIQLWINLPKASKMVKPQYRNVNFEDIPVIEKENVKISVVAGNYEELHSLTKSEYSDIQFLDVQMMPHSSWTMSSNEKYTLFAYIIDGNALFADEDVPFKKAVLFTEGNTLSVTTQENSVRFFLLSAEPLHEPIAWGGPIVMNTDEELKQAYFDLENHTFIQK